jgi:hypothetical protein
MASASAWPTHAGVPVAVLSATGRCGVIRLRSLRLARGPLRVRSRRWLRSPPGNPSRRPLYVVSIRCTAPGFLHTTWITSRQDRPFIRGPGNIETGGHPVRDRDAHTRLIRDPAKHDKLWQPGCRHASPGPLGCPEHPPPCHGAGPGAPRHLPGGRGPHGLRPPPRRPDGAGRLDRLRLGVPPQPRPSLRPEGDAAARAQHAESPHPALRDAFNRQRRRGGNPTLPSTTLAMACHHTILVQLGPTTVRGTLTSRL